MIEDFIPSLEERWQGYRALMKRILPCPPHIEPITLNRRTPWVRDIVFRIDHSKCVNCGATEDLTLDHIISVKGGGEDKLENFQTLCKSCNSKKGAKSWPTKL